MKFQRIVLACVAATSLACCQGASAQYGLGGGHSCGFGGLGGFGYGAYLGVGDLYRVLAANVPYYAAFPPVYYNAPVPRSYGYSPFAYLPHVQTPQVEVQVEPLAIENPYFKQEVQEVSVGVPADARPEDTTTEVRPAVKPLTIINPYVTPAGTQELALRAAR